MFTSSLPGRTPDQVERRGLSTLSVWVSSMGWIFRPYSMQLPMPLTPKNGTDFSELSKPYSYPT